MIETRAQVIQAAMAYLLLPDGTKAQCRVLVVVHEPQTELLTQIRVWTIPLDTDYDYYTWFCDLEVRVCLSRMILYAVFCRHLTVAHVPVPSHHPLLPVQSSMVPFLLKIMQNWLIFYHRSCK